MHSKTFRTDSQRFFKNFGHFHPVLTRNNNKNIIRIAAVTSAKGINFSYHFYIKIYHSDVCSQCRYWRALWDTILLLPTNHEVGGFSIATTN